MPTIESRGVPISYELVGQGPPVLLIQGVGAIGRAWRPQSDALRDRHRLAYFDNRGIGQSARGDGPLSVEAMAKDALAVMDAAGFDRAHVVGHSMGGVIAQQLALEAPSRVRSLALLCTFFRGRDGSRLPPALMLRTLVAYARGRAARRQAFLELVMPRQLLRSRDGAALAAELGAVFERDLADQPPIVMAQLRALSRSDLSRRLGQLAPIPTLVVSAAEDPIARPASGRALAAAIPGARYLELADAGHAVPVHDAARVNELLAQHFAAAP